jgi:hypothetical protein
MQYGGPPGQWQVHFSFFIRSASPPEQTPLLRPFRIILQAPEFSPLRKTKIIGTRCPAMEIAGMIARLMDAVPMRAV